MKSDGEILPIEVKEKDIIKKDDIKTLVYFMKKYKLDNGVVVYSGEEKTLVIKGEKIVLYPIHKLLFDFSLDIVPEEQQE